jgi:hypothetical protein
MKNYRDLNKVFTKIVFMPIVLSLTLTGLPVSDALAVEDPITEASRGTGQTSNNDIGAQGQTSAYDAQTQAINTATLEEQNRAEEQQTNDSEVDEQMTQIILDFLPEGQEYAAQQGRDGNEKAVVVTTEDPEDSTKQIETLIVLNRETGKVRFAFSYPVTTNRVTGLPESVFSFASEETSARITFTPPSSPRQARINRQPADDGGEMLRVNGPNHLYETRYAIEDGSTQNLISTAAFIVTNAVAEQFPNDPTRTYRISANENGFVVTVEQRNDETVQLTFDADGNRTVTIQDANGQDIEVIARQDQRSSNQINYFLAGTDTFVANFTFLQNSDGESVVSNKKFYDPEADGTGLIFSDTFDVETGERTSRAVYDAYSSNIHTKLGLVIDYADGETTTTIHRAAAIIYDNVVPGGDRFTSTEVNAVYNAIAVRYGEANATNQQYDLNANGQIDRGDVQIALDIINLNRTDGYDTSVRPGVVLSDAIATFGNPFSQITIPFHDGPRYAVIDAPGFGRAVFTRVVDGVDHTGRNPQKDYFIVNGDEATGYKLKTEVFSSRHPERAPQEFFHENPVITLRTVRDFVGRTTLNDFDVSLGYSRFGFDPIGGLTFVLESKNSDEPSYVLSFRGGTLTEAIATDGFSDVVVDPNYYGGKPGVSVTYTNSVTNTRIGTFRGQYQFDYQDQQTGSFEQVEFAASGRSIDNLSAFATLFTIFESIVSLIDTQNGSISVEVADDGFTVTQTLPDESTVELQFDEQGNQIVAADVIVTIQDIDGNDIDVIVREDETDSRFQTTSFFVINEDGSAGYRIKSETQDTFRPDRDATEYFYDNPALFPALISDYLGEEALDNYDIEFGFTRVGFNNDGNLTYILNHKDGGDSFVLLFQKPTLDDGSIGEYILTRAHFSESTITTTPNGGNGDGDSATFSYSRLLNTLALASPFVPEDGSPLPYFVLGENGFTSFTVGGQGGINQDGINVVGNFALVQTLFNLPNTLGDTNVGEIAITVGEDGDITASHAFNLSDLSSIAQSREIVYTAEGVVVSDTVSVRVNPNSDELTAVTFVDDVAPIRLATDPNRVKRTYFLINPDGSQGPKVKEVNSFSFIDGEGNDLNRHLDNKIEIIRFFNADSGKLDAAYSFYGDARFDPGALPLGTIRKYHTRDIITDTLDFANPPAMYLLSYNVDGDQVGYRNDRLDGVSTAINRMDGGLNAQNAYAVYQDIVATMGDVNVPDYRFAAAGIADEEGSTTQADLDLFVEYIVSELSFGAGFQDAPTDLDMFNALIALNPTGDAEQDTANFRAAITDVLSQIIGDELTPADIDAQIASLVSAASVLGISVGAGDIEAVISSDEQERPLMTRVYRVEAGSDRVGVVDRTYTYAVTQSGRRWRPTVTTTTTITDQVASVRGDGRVLQTTEIEVKTVSGRDTTVTTIDKFNAAGAVVAHSEETRTEKSRGRVKLVSTSETFNSRGEVRSKIKKSITTYPDGSVNSSIRTYEYDYAGRETLDEYARVYTNGRTRTTSEMHAYNAAGVELTKRNEDIRSYPNGSSSHDIRETTKNDAGVRIGYTRDKANTYANGLSSTFVSVMTYDDNGDRQSLRTNRSYNFGFFTVHVNNSQDYIRRRGRNRATNREYSAQFIAGGTTYPVMTVNRSTFNRGLRQVRNLFRSMAR